MKMEDVKVSTTFFVIGHMLNVCQVSKTILAILVGKCVCLSTSGLVVGF